MIQVSFKKGLSFGTIMVFLVGKRRLYGNHVWPEPKDITSPGRFGISYIDATRGSSCLGSPKTGAMVAAAL
jgi:hypothetical protein